MKPLLFLILSASLYAQDKKAAVQVPTLNTTTVPPGFDHITADVKTKSEIILAPEVVASVRDLYQRLLGAAEVAAAVEKAAKEADAARDAIQQQLAGAMAPYCKMAKIDLAQCGVNFETGALSASAKTAPKADPK